MRRAIYPGSFDPTTNGHLDVIERASHLCDELIVAVAINDQKHKTTLFSIEERIELLEEVCFGMSNVRIAHLRGLLVDFARKAEAQAIVRGLRAVSDFEFEFQMALMNRKMEPAIETIFLMPKEDYSYLSSRIVKEISQLGGQVGEFVPPTVEKALKRKWDQGLTE
jgi:pantetheine-phosphate adenylyltransferase